MGIISRYVATTWLRLFLLCQGGFLAVYLILDFMEKLGRFLKAGAGFGLIGSFFLFKLPEMLGQTNALCRFNVNPAGPGDAFPQQAS